MSHRLLLLLAAPLVLACGSTSPSSPAAQTEPGATEPVAPAPPVSPAPPPVDLDQVFPDLADFTRAPAPDHYDPVNLYDYIDGAAELFLHYGFVELASLEYRQGSGPTEQAVTADVYRHSSDNNGFGIYSRDHVRGTALAGIGGAAAYAPSALHFVKGRYYVKLTGYQLSDDAGLLGRVATGIAARLDGPDQLPAPVGCFPPDPAAPVEYHASGYLGHGFLEAVFAADYGTDNGPKTKVILVDAPDPERATTTLAAYVALAEKKGIAVTRADDTSRLGDPYHRELGPLHGRLRNRYLVLVFDADDAHARTILDQLSSCLDKL